MDKIDNKEFLKLFHETIISNTSFIESIRFNKKSITVKIHDINFFFNDFYTRNTLYNEIIGVLVIYYKNHGINYIDKDFLACKYPKINIRSC